MGELVSCHMEVQQKTGGPVIARVEVDPYQIRAYGCADITAVDGEEYVRGSSRAAVSTPATS